MKKTILYILVIILIAFTIFVSASAHAGGTDANGGHIDNSTGGYHYHHGYPAHSHIGGCPYSYNDKTGESSGTTGTAQQAANADDDGGAVAWIVILLAAAAASLYGFFKCEGVVAKNVLFFLTDIFTLISGVVALVNGITFFGIVLIIAGFVSFVFHFKWFYFDS